MYDYLYNCIEIHKCISWMSGSCSITYIIHGLNYKYIWLQTSGQGCRTCDEWCKHSLNFCFLRRAGRGAARAGSGSTAGSSWPNTRSCTRTSGSTAAGFATARSSSRPTSTSTTGYIQVRARDMWKLLKLNL